MQKRLISKKEAKVGIIGLGYVGLPLALEIARAGFKVIGIDIDKKRVAMINRGISFISDVDSKELKYFVSRDRIKSSTSYAKLRDCDIIIICVPTPININKEPDLSAVVECTHGIRNYLKKGQLIILKSTTYPETTEGVILPILKSSGLKVGKDFFLAFCPERIDPGNKKYGIANTPVVVGGVTKNCTRMATLFYRQFVNSVFPVSSPKVAEMTKLLENTFRNVNIALVNEFAQLCERIGGIDIWEVIDAAKTKPFGYMPFYPGPGVGGHCIPIDPYYLSWKAREYDFHTAFIELSARINEEMPYFVVNKIIDALGKSGRCSGQAKILLLGMAFKKDISDLRHSPSLKVYQILKARVQKVLYNDPYIPELRDDNKIIRSVALTAKLLKKMDAVVILTNHSKYDYDFIARHSRLIIDTRNAVKKQNRKVVKLGLGR
ncbi:UDP-N-acetyl-D-glucosamine dehydrogenase [candidate division WOR-3 bacterium 4484_100]|uniref:UDP-N-acetyl-D-glucosamine dehydrogenase n=1 Tax=candidate division WOR-3 bacterium 4484_100 TaxID=1936077 RepID=A0A1V4QFN9_UNCW3|nr:MAG: UDP-N-acetyl-D-glucosamine dehydrogenase [candidate division WOR-3 bacterium 4484_100]